VRGFTSSSLNREFLFFGDVESDWRREGEESFDAEGQAKAREYNEAIWTEAADSWDHGRLAGVFVSFIALPEVDAEWKIECSYDSDRPAHLMFGHVCPPGLYHELKRFASKVKPKE
jgi:cAMP phosphodiesterase